MPLSPRTSQSSKIRAARTAVLHLSPDLEPGDPGRETVDLAILCQRREWRALIASGGGILVNEAERAAVRHWRIPFVGQNIFGDWRSRVKLERLFHKERPAIVHAHGIDTVPFALALGRNHRVPVIVDLTQPIADTPRSQRVMEQLKAMPEVMVRVPTDFMAQHLMETFKLDDEQIALIPPGVDLQWMGAGFVSPERLQTLSQTLRLPDQATVILVPMPLSEDMGHKVFLEAVAQLKNENIYAILAGSDRTAPGQRQDIEQLISQLGLNGKIIMPEFCKDLPATCWLSSVVVASNIAPRGQNLEVLAAQAIGRPVIVTDIGANPAMALRDETAWVVPPNDMRAMADALSEAIHLDTEQRLDLAERTHNFIAENFPQGAWYEGMTGLYEKALQPVERGNRQKAA